MKTQVTSLNPCYSGICSVSQVIILLATILICLNPCYSGICSVRMLSSTSVLCLRVLILVIVEYAL